MKFIALLIVVMGNAALAATPKISLRAVVKNAAAPVEVINDGKRFFVVEQGGTIRQIEDGKLRKEPLLDISDHVTYQGECGFLGVAFHPDFAKNGYLYVDYTTGRWQGLRTVIAEFHADTTGKAPGDHIDPQTERQVLTIKQPYANHNGGQVKFGPDGLLYIGMGDGGSANDPQNRAQNPKELLGKILRIDVNDRKPYAVPKDNPFVDNPEFRPEIWAWGMRNPWRFTFDGVSGTLIAGDVGQNQWEEVDVITKGGNYGWHIREGLHPFREDQKPASQLIDPIAEYGHDKGLSITGGVVYRGKKFPDLVGVYIYGDYMSGRFWGLRYDNGKVLANEELKITVDGKSTLNRIQPTGFGEDADGEIYVCDYAHGGIYQIVAE